MDDLSVEMKPIEGNRFVRVEAKNVSYTIKIKKKEKCWQASKCCQHESDKRIIHDVNMLLEPGQLTAIMGPSGSGKTTFVDILSGRIKSHITGDVLVNGQRFNDIGKISGYVKQQDLLLASSTVREALTFSALLRLPRDMSRKEKNERVNHLIELLGLTKCADERIGDESKRGISGGELKRVSIGCEMIINPRLLFLDEPTSGLDSTSAYSVMGLLKRLTVETQCSVITTIHQPSAHIFKLFDRLIMMYSGEVVYQGPPTDAKEFFALCGHECPQFTNQPDFFMDVVMGTLPEEELNRDAMTVQEMVDTFKKSDYSKKALTASEVKVEPIKANDVKGESANIITQFSELCKRTWKDNSRNPLILQAQLFQHIFLGLLIGLMYLRLGSSEGDTRRDRAASIFFILINATFPPAMTAAMVIPRQRPIFNREREAGAYTLLPYFMSTVIVGLPVQIVMTLIDVALCYWMIGYSNSFTEFVIFYAICLLLLLVTESIGVFVSSFCPTSDSASTITSLVLLVFMSFGGFLLKPENVPKFFLPFDFLSPFKYAYRALLMVNMKDLYVTCPPIMGPCPIGCSATDICEYPCSGSGFEFIKEMGLHDSAIYIDILILIAMLLIYRLLTYFVLLLIPVRRKQ